jgi:hypothetical protein
MQNITLYVTLVSDNAISRQLDEAKMLMTPVLVPRGINVILLEIMNRMRFKE